MSFLHQGISYRSLNEFVDGQTASGLFDADGTPAYAYRMDRWILTALNSTPVKKVIDEAVHGLIDLQFGNMMASSISISGSSFPEIHEILAGCSRTLGISMPYAMARSEESLFNAYTAGTDGGAFVVVSTGILRFFKPEEVCFVIGHECGHIAAEHMTYKVAVDALSKAVVPFLGLAGLALQRVAGLPLMAWSRRAEITADRAGMLCTRDLQAAERALVRLASGMAERELVDIDDFLRQSRKLQGHSNFAFFQNLMASHPMIPQRVEALRLFAKSEMYHRLTGQSPAAKTKLLSDKELQRRTAAIVKP